MYYERNPLKYQYIYIAAVQISRNLNRKLNMYPQSILVSQNKLTEPFREINWCQMEIFVRCGKHRAQQIRLFVFHNFSRCMETMWLSTSDQQVVYSERRSQYNNKYWERTFVWASVSAVGMHITTSITKTDQNFSIIKRMNVLQSRSSQSTNTRNFASGFHDDLFDKYSRLVITSSSVLSMIM